MINGNNDKISVQGSMLALASFDCALGNVAAQEVDLTPYQGQMVRVYLDGNLQIRINPKEDMFWQLAEMALPAPHSRQVQQGTVQVVKTKSVIIMRGDSDFDAVPGIDGREISAVGHYWQNLRKGIEWQAEATGVRWIGERSPQTGEEYPVELKEISEEPYMVSVIDALDLDDITIQVFENPA